MPAIQSSHESQNTRFKKSDWSDKDKTEAIALWEAAASQIEMRNTIAHNPFVIAKDGNKGILKISELRGSPPYNPTLMTFHGVVEVHNKSGVLGNAIHTFIQSRQVRHSK
jgi:hypothetical protein